MSNYTYRVTPHIEVLSNSPESKLALTVALPGVQCGCWHNLCDSIHMYLHIA